MLCLSMFNKRKSSLAKQCIFVAQFATILSTVGNSTEWSLTVSKYLRRELNKASSKSVLYPREMENVRHRGWWNVYRLRFECREVMSPLSKVSETVCRGTLVVGRKQGRIRVNFFYCFHLIYPGVFTRARVSICLVITRQAATKNILPIGPSSSRSPLGNIDDIDNYLCTIIRETRHPLHSDYLILW